jgi:hypothetical protein
MVNLHTIESNVTQMLGSALNRNATGKEFVFKYWTRFDSLGTRINTKRIGHLADPESILRSRRRFAALSPKFRPNHTVQKARASKERKLRKHYSQ